MALFGVGVALGLFSAPRFYMVTWLGERITADLRNAVYAHVVRQSRVQIRAAGQVEFRLNTPSRDGKTHLSVSSLEFMHRLAAQVPRPRIQLTG